MVRLVFEGLPSYPTADLAVSGRYSPQAPRLQESFGDVQRSAFYEYWVKSQIFRSPPKTPTMPSGLLADLPKILDAVPNFAHDLLPRHNQHKS